MAPRDSPVVAHVSVDTLYISIDGELRPGVVAQLAELRRVAEESEQLVAGPWSFNGQPILVRWHGWYSYTFWLTCECWDLMVTRSDRLPAVFAQLRQAWLYEMGDPLECYTRLLRWITEYLLVTVDRTVVSRLDLAADVIGYPEDALRPERYTCRARESRQRFERGRCTGIEWGVRGSPVFCRLYDKTLEAFVHQKTWCAELWRPHGWDPGERAPVLDRYGNPKRNADGSVRLRWIREPERVFRLEFECRAEFLDRFSKEGELRALKAPEEVLANAGHLWQYLVGRWQVGKDRHRSYVGWLVLREQRADGHRTRWPPPSWWERMAQDGLSQARLCDVVRRQQQHFDADALLRQAAGCVAQRAAILGDTTILEAATDFVREWTRLLAEKGTTFDQVIEVKRKRYSARLRPGEKPVQAAVQREAVACPT